MSVDIYKKEIESKTKKYKTSNLGYLLCEVAFIEQTKAGDGVIANIFEDTPVKIGGIDYPWHEVMSYLLVVLHLSEYHGFDRALSFIKKEYKSEKEALLYDGIAWRNGQYFFVEETIADPESKTATDAVVEAVKKKIERKKSNPGKTILCVTVPPRYGPTIDFENLAKYLNSLSIDVSQYSVYVILYEFGGAGELSSIIIYHSLEETVDSDSAMQKIKSEKRLIRLNLKDVLEQFRNK